MAVAALTSGCQIVGGFDGYFRGDEVGGEGGAGNEGGADGGMGGVADGGTGGTGGVGGEGGMMGCQQTVAFVDGDATGNDDGTSWSDAFSDLQDALASLEDCPSITEVWVAEGSYSPGASASDAFALRDGVRVYGGFSGTEAALVERDWVANTTILTGDIASDDAVVDGVVVDPNDITGTNSSHVVTAAGVDATAVLDGFTITGGSAEGTDDSGGGIACGDGGPTLRNLVVRGNRAVGDGGGLHGTGAPVIEASSFYDNEAVNGGAVAMTGGTLRITRSEMLRNDATGDGGAIALDGASSQLARIYAAQNSAGAAGGALSISGGVHELHNSGFGGNYAVWQGGAWHVSDATLTAINATVVGNRSDVVGGAYHTGTGAVSIRNGLIWNNAHLAGTGTIAANIFSAGPTVTVDYSLLQSSGGSAAWDNAAGTDGGNNTDVDPQLVAPTDPALAPDGPVELRVAVFSPAVDAGDQTIVVDSEDLGGVPRLGYDDVDQGAYELYAPCLDAIVYVDADATGFATGDSWADAFGGLQRALFHKDKCADAAEVWVAEGLYKPGTTRGDTFALRNGLRIYGGFDGTEAILDERDVAANLTVLSGDIDGDDVVDADGIVSDWADVTGNNSYSVVRAGGVDVTTILDGVVISAGYATGTGDDRNGGGIDVGDGSPTLANLTVIGNVSFGSGGGLFAASGSALSMSACELRNNHGNLGGGLFLQAPAGASLVDVTVDDNHANQGAGADLVGGVVVWAGAIITNNEAVDGGATSIGGGLNVRDATVTLTDALIQGNIATRGGGVYNDLGAYSFENVLITGNHARSQGGGWRMRKGSSTLTNVTIAGNRADRGGGIWTEGTGGWITLRNSIIWGNVQEAAGPLLQSSVDNRTPGGFQASYSIVQHSGGSAAWDATIGVDLGNNTDTDPQFTTPLDPLTAPSLGGDFRVPAGSPALDSGDDTLVTTATDLDGNARLNGTVDRGPYELP